MDKAKILDTAKKSYQLYRKNKGTLQKIAASPIFHPAPVRDVEHNERQLLPVLMKDYPEFDLGATKGAVRKALEEKYGAEKGYTLHKIVLSGYRNGNTLVFQAAFATKDGLATVQRRVTLHQTCFEDQLWHFTHFAED